MSRAQFSRDELLSALRVLSKILRAFPDGVYTDDGTEASVVPRRGLPPDGSFVTPGSMIPADGAPPIYGYGKGQLQPPRKQYGLAPKVKIDRINNMPRAAQRIATLLSQSKQPMTSHEIMQQLSIARPTFNNSMSKLVKTKIVVAVTARSAGREISDQR